ncbi:putative muscarinic acetylcholine receptor gar-1 domain protein [Brugia pahangi]
MACEIWLFLDYTLYLVSIPLLITVDRCLSLSYLKWQSSTKVQITIICSWLIPALIFGFMIYDWSLVSSAKTEVTKDECAVPFLTNPYVNMGLYVV